MRELLVLDQKGFSLLELTVAIIIIGLLLAVAMQSMTSMMGDVRRTKTDREMEILSKGIVGDPNVMESGGRTDFGYVGDIGAFPPNIDALYNNPGGYATWQGPYLPTGITQDSTGLKTDEWGTAYNYSGGITITSTGSGSTISKKIARATNDYLRNTVNGRIEDGADSPPGPIEKDSIDVKIAFPNGTGGTQTKLYHPDALGLFTLDSVPVGSHSLRIIYLPLSDTIFRYLNVYPRHKDSVFANFAPGYFTDTVPVGPGLVIIRPNGAGTYTDHNTSGCPSNWQCVDEAVSDDEVTYVQSPGGAWDNDTYTMEDPTPIGTIDSVVVCMNVHNTAENNQRARTIVRVNNSNYYGTDEDLDGETIYNVFVTNYTTNPFTTVAWTWTDINALQGGVRMRRQPRCTQVWVEVYYQN